MQKVANGFNDDIQNTCKWMCLCMLIRTCAIEFKKNMGKKSNNLKKKSNSVVRLKNKLIFSAFHSNRSMENI